MALKQMVLNHLALRELLNSLSLFIKQLIIKIQMEQL